MSVAAPGGRAQGWLSMWVSDDSLLKYRPGQSRWVRPRGWYRNAARSARDITDGRIRCSHGYAAATRMSCRGPRAGASPGLAGDPSPTASRRPLHCFSCRGRCDAFSSTADSPWEHAWSIVRRRTVVRIPPSASCDAAGRLVHNTRQSVPRWSVQNSCRRSVTRTCSYADACRCTCVCRCAMSCPCLSTCTSTCRRTCRRGFYRP